MGKWGKENVFISSDVRLMKSVKKFAIFARYSHDLQLIQNDLYRDSPSTHQLLKLTSSELCRSKCWINCRAN